MVQKSRIILDRFIEFSISTDSGLFYFFLQISFIWKFSKIPMKISYRTIDRAFSVFVIDKLKFFHGNLVSGIILRISFMRKILDLIYTKEDHYLKNPWDYTSTVSLIFFYDIRILEYRRIFCCGHVRVSFNFTVTKMLLWMLVFFPRNSSRNIVNRRFFFQE